MSSQPPKTLTPRPVSVARWVSTGAAGPKLLIDPTSPPTPSVWLTDSLCACLLGTLDPAPAALACGCGVGAIPAVDAVSGGAVVAGALLFVSATRPIVTCR